MVCVCVCVCEQRKKVPKHSQLCSNGRYSTARAISVTYAKIAVTHTGGGSYKVDNTQI